MNHYNTFKHEPSSKNQLIKYQESINMLIDTMQFVIEKLAHLC